MIPSAMDATGLARRLADVLGDTPETVIPCHQLLRGLARCWIAGKLPNVTAAVVQAIENPAEPFGYGRDPAALWDLLTRIDGWTCVSVEPSIAAPLARLIEAHRGAPTRLYGDIYHTLMRPVAVVDHPAVRRLDLDDVGLIAAAPEEVRGSNWGGTRAMIAEGCVAGAIVGGNLVASAMIGAITACHADIGVATLVPYRRQGIRHRRGFIVARWAQDYGRIPVWSTGEDNLASLGVARRLGFVEVSRRVYVIAERPR